MCSTCRGCWVVVAGPHDLPTETAQVQQSLERTQGKHVKPCRLGWAYESSFLWAAWVNPQLFDVVRCASTVRPFRWIEEGLSALITVCFLMISTWRWFAVLYLSALFLGRRVIGRRGPRPLDDDANTASGVQRGMRLVAGWFVVAFGMNY